MMPDIRYSPGNSIAYWVDPPACPRLEPGELQVWRAAIDLCFPDRQRLADSLSVDERKRLERFRFERDRDHFIVRRGILRTLLGRYLDISPTDVALEMSAEGKLLLATQGIGREPIEFNLAHAGGIAVFAFVRDQRIGIDIERVHPFPEAKDITQGYFAQEEREALNLLTGDQYWRAFFNCWTRKEAYLKAKGQGLLEGLRHCSVFGQTAHPQKPSSRWWRTTEPPHWTILDFIPAPGYQAALATSGTPNTIRYWRVAPNGYE